MSFGVRPLMERVESGKLSPLWDETGPPSRTSQATSPSSMLSTRSPMRPSSMSRRWPGRTSSARFSYEVESRLASPVKSPGASTMRLPSTSSVPSSTSPVRILGPCTSCKMATLRPTSLATLRTISAFLRCMLCSPWEKLNLVTSTPERISDPMASSVEVAGPSVATIFVLRMGSDTLPRLDPGVESGPARVESRVSECLFYAQELVVLGDALAAGRSPGLDLPGVHRHGQIGDRRVLRFAAAVADHGRVARFVGEIHGLKRLG